MNIQIIINNSYKYKNIEALKTSVESEKIIIQSFKVIKEGLTINRSSGRYSHDLLFDYLEELQSEEAGELEKIGEMLNSWDDRDQLEAATLLKNHDSDRALYFLVELCEHKKTEVQERAFHSLLSNNRINQNVVNFICNKLFSFNDCTKNVQMRILRIIDRWNMVEAMPGLKHIFEGAESRPYRIFKESMGYGVEVLGKLKREHAIV